MRQFHFNFCIMYSLNLCNDVVLKDSINWNLKYFR